MAFSSTSERPTLPPLHTLDLPRGKLFHNELDGTYERQTPSLRMPSTRQLSISSSTTSSSRSPSPSPSNFTACSHSSSSDESDHIRVRLIPSTLETADAVVIVPPPDASHIRSLPSLSSLSTISSLPNAMDESERARAMLFLGPALQHLRHPQRQIAKGARMHPYRIIKTRHARKSNHVVEICI